MPLLTGEPAIRGRFFFREDLRGLNFQRRPAPLSAALRLLLTHLDDTEPPATTAQVWLSPAAMASAPRMPETETGVIESVTLPSPSCPEAL